MFLRNKVLFQLVSLCLCVRPSLHLSAVRPSRGGAVPLTSRRNLGTLCGRALVRSTTFSMRFCPQCHFPYVFDINQPSLPIPFYSLLVSVSVFMALSAVFHSINSPDNSPLSHFVLPVLFLPCWLFQLHTSL